MPNPTPAELIEHLERYEVTQGALAGQRLHLMPWQRKFLRAVLRPDVSTAALSVARGNGKSGLVAGLASLYLGPLDTGTRGEAACFAASFGQARAAIGEQAMAFLGGKAQLRKDGMRVEDNSNRFVIQNESGAKLSVIAADARRAHGRPGLVIALLDEPAQWPVNVSDKLLAAITTSGGKQTGFKVIALGTRPSDPEHWFSRWLDGGCDYAQVHSAGEDEVPFNARTWAKANPSMRYFPALRKAIKDDAKRAKEDSGQLAAFKSLRLNLGVSEVDRAMLLDAGVWASCMSDNPPERVGPAIWGVDLGTSGMSAISAFWPLSGRLEAIAAFPEIPSLTERGRLDRVGNHTYQKLFAAGELLAAGMRIVDVPKLLQIALQRFGVPAVVVADRWRAAELTQSLDAAGFPGAELVVRGMGWRDGSADCRSFVSAAVSREIRTHKSALLTWGISGAVVMKDPAGNIKLQKTKHRDDAAAAAILAVAEGRRRHGLLTQSMKRRTVVVV